MVRLALCTFLGRVSVGVYDVGERCIEIVIFEATHTHMGIFLPECIQFGLVGGDGEAAVSELYFIASSLA